MVAIEKLGITLLLVLNEKLFLSSIPHLDYYEEYQHEEI